MRFGIFSNQTRQREDMTASWREDIEEVVAADKAGFEEAWISEHSATAFIQDGIPAADLIISQMALLTKNIKLGPAVRRLALHNPVEVAIQASVCDHLSGGRYMIGFGHGGWIAGYEQRGIDPEVTHDMLAEAVLLVERCWTETEPFDYEGQFYRGKNISVYPKPAQKPHPPVAVASRQPKLLKITAEHGHILLVSQYEKPPKIGQLAREFNQLCLDAGRGSCLKDVTTAHAVYVAMSDKQAHEDLAKDWERYLRNYATKFPYLFEPYLPEGMTFEDASLDDVIESGLIFAGSPDTVAEHITRYYDDSGKAFGTLLLVMGKDWGTLEQRKRSLQLFAEQVKPRLEGLDADADNAGHLEPVAVGAATGAPSNYIQG